MSSSDKSVHSANVQEIHVMPISEIIRPIPSVLDEKKVDSLVETLKVLKDKITIYSHRSNFYQHFNFAG